MCPLRIYLFLTFKKISRDSMNEINSGLVSYKIHYVIKEVQLFENIILKFMIVWVYFYLSIFNSQTFLIQDASKNPDFWEWFWDS